ncbi:MAG: PEP-utilizing enzyme, partial [Proteobacteria bacterium]|nr:PEP-utilizing enzyme [Pseudomonadota bacterium]
MGERVGAGVRALNPGLARGVIREVKDGQSALDLDPNGIYLLPETTPDLAPVAGILTRGEGSSLSHLQLLARNLGIPNVVVGRELVDAIRARSGKKIVLAVSPGGVCPSGDRLLESLARDLGVSCGAAVLTGMGCDGAAGLK